MKNHVMTGAVLAALSLALSTPVEAKPAKSTSKAAKSITWKSSFQAALKEAKRTRKPIMVDFYTTWCGPCKMLDMYTYTHPKVIAESRKWVSVKIDAEQQEALAQRYGVTGFPTVLFLKPNGQPAVRTSGFYPPDIMLKAMKYAHPKSR